MSKAKKTAKTTGFLTSKYAGRIARAKTKFPQCKTVGELREAIAHVPAELPLNDAMRPLWFNIGHSESYMPESMGFDDMDSWDDDE